MAAYTFTTLSRCSGVTAPSRRELFSAAGFTALAGIAAATIAKPDAQADEVQPTPHDAELAAIGNEAGPLANQYRALIGQWFATPKEHGADKRISDAQEPIGDRLDALTERAIDLRATTRAAMEGKAHLIRHQIVAFHTIDGELVVDDYLYLVLSLVDDLIGEVA